MFETCIKQTSMRVLDLLKQYVYICYPHSYRRMAGFIVLTHFCDVKLSEQNEILIKHDALMDGYYKMKEETQKTIIDGWLHTGDEGEIDANGFLTITGRVKDLFKTSKGKYVAPSPIEMKLSANKNIEQVCVVGTELPQPIAIVVLSERGKNKSPEDLISSFITTLEVVNLKLDNHERIHNLVVVKEYWTVENKLLTPTMKIKRHSIEKLYKANYKDWYEGQRVSLVESKNLPN